MIKLEYVNEVYLKVNAENSILKELREFFSFYAPKHWFHPKVKAKVWNGKIYLLDSHTRLIYAGLKPRIYQFAEDRGYTIKDNNVIKHEAMTITEAQLFIEHLILPFKPYDYQVEAFREAIISSRKLLLAPTSSGKSLIQYLIARYFYQTQNKVLILVPNIGLVGQMYGDFIEYNNNKELDIHCITGGVPKDVAPITISTWQSIYKLDSIWFNQFKCIIEDEVHGGDANSLKGIMEKAINIPYRFGLTGTLKDTKLHVLTLEGLFGSTYEVTTYKELKEKEIISDIVIRVIMFKYPKEVCKTVMQFKYPDEYKHILFNQKRNADIARLISSLKGNVLVLFRIIDHGKSLHTMFKQTLPNHLNHLVYGKTDKDDREELRKIIENNNDVIATCSYKTFGTGINVKNLHHIVFASPFISKIQTLQTIGRGLRLHDSKDHLTLWDLSDDFRTGKTKNHTLKQLVERINIYKEVEFNYSIHERPIT